MLERGVVVAQQGDLPKLAFSAFVIRRLALSHPERHPLGLKSCYAMHPAGQVVAQVLSAPIDQLPAPLRPTTAGLSATAPGQASLFRIRARLVTRHYERELDRVI